MCYNCGKVYAKWESKIEDKLGQFTEIAENPHDIGHSLVGLQDKKKKTDIQKQHDRLLKRIEQEPDEDIKKELRKGNTVEYDSGNY